MRLRTRAGWLLRAVGAACCLRAASASAIDIGRLLDDFDFNDYAVGVASAMAQQPYLGVGHTRMLYPYLSSVQDSTLTRGTFVARNGTYGFRHVSPSGLEIGVLGRLEVLGFGSEPDPPLDRLEPPQWTLEAGPSIGWRRGVIQPDLSLRKGIWGGHDSWVAEFSLSAPMKLERGYVVPFASIIYQGSDYLDHYFAPRPRGDQELPLPSYAVPDSAKSYRLGFRAGYRLSDLWVLTGSARVDFLGDGITDSPLVGRDTVGALTVGLAYNRSIFTEQTPDWRGELSQKRFALSIFRMAGSTRSDLLLQDSSAGTSPGTRDDRLDGASLQNGDTDFFRMDAVWRIQARHRIEASYAEINRSRTIAPGTFVGQEESGGENPLRLNQRSRFARAAYGYSLVNTAQKELGVLLGLHWPRLQATINGGSGRVLDEVDAKAPMFSLGVYGRLAMRRGFEALLRAEAGGLDIGQYDGRVFDARGLLAWNPRDSFALLAGYGWQITRLDGYTEGFRGRFDQRTHGPLIGLRLTF